jgi:hypothetical protein
MQNKTSDWLEDALDALPTQPPSLAFRGDLQARLQREGLRAATSVMQSAPAGRGFAEQGRLLPFARALLTAAAAVLLISLGYQLGADSGNHGTTIIDSSGAIAEADLIDLYEMRDVIEGWEMTADAELEPGFQAIAAADETWVDEILTDGQK